MSDVTDAREDGDAELQHVPTETEGEVVGTLEQVVEDGEAECRLCGETFQGDSFGEIFEALAEHGEEEHEWTDNEGWSA